MSKMKNQYTADGIATQFEFTFSIPVTRELNVYVQIGTQADEVADLLPDSNYTISFTSPSAGLSPGNVIFSVPPLVGKIITIRPSNQTGISTLYSNTTEFNREELNTSFSETSATNSNSQSLYLGDALRYNENENDIKLSEYKNTIAPLEDKAFWRREGSKIISQDYPEFIEEITADIKVDIKDQVNASANNTNLSADIANKSFGVEYAGNVDTIDALGNVISTPITPGQSALSSAKSAELWAVSEVEFTDTYGTVGRSAKHFSEKAETAASSSGGIITELYVKDTSPVTQVNLIDYSVTPNEPWINTLENSFTIYVNGNKLPEPKSYSDGSVVPAKPYTVTIIATPTLATPSFITFNPAIPANQEILIARSEAQGNSATMFVDSSNAIFNTSTKLAARDLSNVTLADSFTQQIIDLTWPIGSIFSSANPILPPSLNLPGVTWVPISEGSISATVGAGINAGANGSVAFNSTLSKQLTTANLPPHTMPIPAGTTPGAGNQVLQAASQTTTINTGITGSGTPFEISRSNTRYFGSYSWQRTV